MRLVKPKAVVCLKKPLNLTRQYKPLQPSNKPHYVALVKHYAHKHGVPQLVALRLIKQESNWNPRARSPVGAKGLTQLMPATAKELHVNPNNPEQAIDGGMRYLSARIRDNQGSIPRALAAYNMGQGALNHCLKTGKRLPKETRDYVAIIWKGKKV